MQVYKVNISTEINKIKNKLKTFFAYSNKRKIKNIRKLS